MKRHAIAAFLVATGIIASGAFANAQAQGQTTQMVDPNRIVLVVNGEEIKGAEYYRRMEYLQGVGIRTGNSFTEFPPGFLTIQHLIDERVAFALAKEKGCYPTDEEVDAEIKDRQDENPKMLDNWIASGGNMEELRYLVRVQLVQFKLQTFGITKTDTEIEQFYSAHTELYTTPKLLRLKEIGVSSSDDTKTVDQALASGKDFSAVAKDLSIAVTKSIGGEFGVIEEYNLPSLTQDALKAIKIGEATKWIVATDKDGKSSYWKFLLEDIIPPKKKDLDKMLRRTIRRKLMTDAGNVKNATLGKELDAERLKVTIDIKQPEFADAYKRFIAAYLKQRGSTQ